MNSSFEQTIERLAIDADIRDLTARFSDAVNRCDPDAFGDLFADDGAWEIGEPFPSGAAGRRIPGYAHFSVPPGPEPRSLAAALSP